MRCRPRRRRWSAFDGEEVSFDTAKAAQGRAATIAAAAAPLTIGSRGLAQAGLQPVNMQLGWITGGNQIGEVVAKRLGYFEQEKINFAIQAGGPNIDGVAIVASGRYEVGQVSSSPSLMLAASQGIPVTCFAVGAQSTLTRSSRCRARRSERRRT